MIQDIQKALNTAYITDYDDKRLVVDGVWGKRTATAFAKLAAKAGSVQPPSPPGILVGDEITIKGVITAE